MTDLDKNKDKEARFTLSYAGSDRQERFATAADAGRAFADADTKLRPRVIEKRDDGGARTVASGVTVGEAWQKSVPTLDSVRRDKANVKSDGTPREGMGRSNLDFWTAFHERTAEREATPAKTRKTARTSGDPDDGTIEPAKRDDKKTDDERFSLPSSYHDRFLVTKTKNQQELFRSYEDARPSIIDKGDRLSTKHADRATAMDMIELAGHRGWQSLKAKGPEEFRREMWIEGSAQGLRVQGYRPSEKDQEEASRRGQMIGERTIERTDQPRGTTQEAVTQKARADASHKDSNVVEMPRANFANGVSGKITDIGTAPYRNREGADPVPFVELERKSGKSERLWSVTIADAVEKHDLKVGDRATFHSPGVEPVTYKTKDKKTGEEVERQGHRRLWDAKDIERSGDIAKGPPEAPQKRDEPTMIEQASPEPQKAKNAAKSSGDATEPSDKQRQQDTNSDRLEDRIKRYEPGDQAGKGPASVLAHMDARLRAEGVPEKDRENARNHAATLLSQSVKSGRDIPVQKLANVTREQEAQVQNTVKVQERQKDEATKGSRER
ncbi:hypothetical protein P775_20165 [Puniceibacterium antarcticum]|uniref:Large polyvalent protein-associated domain-containing protein n=1 Tax=Puniceibacterium antarcticum TaxID=1206336 RepID=A0A2G8R9Z6_9RHOB|nr:LPD7 domain-containing protein [Puniceibacterium antarcticum]PIL18364.1 hypothetical protein P775_20165 [Puniceibacterium antarcticum]